MKKKSLAVLAVLAAPVCRASIVAAAAAARAAMQTQSRHVQ